MSNGNSFSTDDTERRQPWWLAVTRLPWGLRVVSAAAAAAGALAAAGGPHILYHA